MARCKAKAKSTGERCKNGAIADTGVCRLHGGRAALMNRGKGNVNYKDGHRSKLFKDIKLQERLDNILEDPHLLEHRRDVAILDTLLIDTLGAINTDAGASERMWEKAAKIMLEVQIAGKQKDYQRRDEQVDRLDAHIQECLTDAMARAEARKLIQERTSVAQKELDRLTKLSNVLTAEQAMILFQALMNEVGTIRDPEDRARISNNLIKMAGGKS